MDVRHLVQPRRALRALFVASEAFPVAKSGGLGDVCAALPAALTELGVEVRLLLPAYPQALDMVVHRHRAARLPSDGWLIRARMPDSGLPVYLVDRPDLFRRSGGLYQDADGRDWPDNHRRFAALCRAGVFLSLEGDDDGWRPDVVHANDWHAGLLPALLASHGRPRPGTLFTIHNMAYQGNFPLEAARELQLPSDLLTPEGAEFYGNISFLKAGIRYADRLTTVSPTYAREILTPAHGAGLEGVLRSRADDLFGILNGVDYGLWDPANDAALPSRYSADDTVGKAACKAALQHELGFDCSPEIPLVIFVNRLTHQKMADVVVDALPMILARGNQLALHGEGDKELEAVLAVAAREHPRQLSVRIGYEEALAHRITAGGDIALTASRFEPCGLSTMYALRYGTLPVTRPVGGLVDTVVDPASGSAAQEAMTGFLFEGTTAAEMAACVERASARYRDRDSWQQLRHSAMSRDFGWDQSARRYLSLYRDLASSPLVQEPPGGKGSSVSPRRVDELVGPVPAAIRSVPGPEARPMAANADGSDRLVPAQSA